MSINQPGQFDLDEPLLWEPRPARWTPLAMVRRLWRWRNAAITTSNSWIFILWAAAEFTLVSLIVALALINAGPGRPDFGKDFWGDLFTAGVDAPLTETLLFQFIPIFLLRWLRFGTKVQICVSTILFASVHFAVVNFQTGVAAGMVGGIYLAYVFTRGARKSKWTAFWTTAAVHILHNLLSILLILVSGGYPSDATMERRCLEYVAPPTQVIYETDPVEIKKLVAENPAYHNDIVVPSASGVVFTPPEWKEYLELFAQDGIAFMHERKSPAGHRCLVTILLRPNLANIVTLTPMSSRVDLPDNGRWDTGQAISMSAISTPIRYFAGQVDAQNPAHFTIIYYADGRTGAVDGWLKDDDTVQLNLHDQTSSTRGTP